MTKRIDLQFYLDKKDRYEKAVPKLRSMIKDLESKTDGGHRCDGINNDCNDCFRERRKLTALIHELGRVQGVLQVITSLQNTVEREIKTTYGDILIDMIRQPDPNNFVTRWYQLNALDIVMNKKGLRTLIWVGSENIDK